MPRLVTWAIALNCLIWLPTLAIASESEPSTVEQWIEQFEGSDLQARRDAVYELAKLGPESAAAVPALIKGLEDRDDQIWFQSALAIARIGPRAHDATAVLIKNLDNSDDQKRYRAAYALGQIGPDALPALLESLRHDSSRVREGSARAIGWIEVESEGVVAALIAALDDQDPDVQARVAEALANKSHASEPSLVKAVVSDSDRVRAAAALALSNIATESKQTIDALNSVLEDSKEETRAAIVIAR